MCVRARARARVRACVRGVRACVRARARRGGGCGKSVYHFAVASCMAVPSFDVGCELLQAMPPPTPTNCIFIWHMYSGDCRAPNYVVQVNLKHKLYQCGKGVCPLWAVFSEFWMSQLHFDCMKFLISFQSCCVYVWTAYPLGSLFTL